MPTIYFNLKSARECLGWLKDTINDIQNLEREMQELEFLDAVSDNNDRLNSLVNSIERRGIILRSIVPPLVDFPAIINDMPAFLCWKGGEEDILYWHYFDEGFSGRKKISGKERILEPL